MKSYSLYNTVQEIKFRNNPFQMFGFKHCSISIYLTNCSDAYLVPSDGRAATNISRKYVEG